MRSSSCPDLPPSPRLRRPRTEKARRSLGVDGCRAFTSWHRLSKKDVDGRDEPGHHGKTNHAAAEIESAMTVYVIAQLKITDRAAYDRYQVRFFEVCRKFNWRPLYADKRPTSGGA